MVTVDLSDNTCSAFGSITGAEPGSIVRFVVGEDLTPRQLSSAEVARELGDPFAVLLLLQGKFPVTAEELLTAIDAAIGPGDPLSASSQRSFILGEGSQLPIGPGGIQSTNRGIRFLVSRGSLAHGPELIISASHPHQGLVELMAWDPVVGGFNYYRTLGDQGEWVFAGNSANALSAPTQGKGPFESHPSGSLLMKELKFPWVHWHSFKANIFENVFPEDDARRVHPWFTKKLGANVCEETVVMSSIRRWASARLDRVIRDNGDVRDAPRVVEQIVTSATVNLTSSSRESAVAASAEVVDLPPTFFVDADGLEIVGLPAPPTFAVAGALYASSLEKFAFVLRDGAGFEQRGDTHFAFVVPERAFEDNELVRQAIDRGLISKRLAAALLMVDFPNPIFSSRRATLLRHAPTTAVMGGASTFSDEMAQRIRNGSGKTPSGSPEREFADLWGVGQDWPAAFGSILASYYNAVQEHLSTQEGFDDFTRLADSRRNRVREMPIFESPLLFPETNIPRARLAMRRDGSVQDLAGAGGAR